MKSSKCQRSSLTRPHYFGIPKAFKQWLYHSLIGHTIAKGVAPMIEVLYHRWENSDIIRSCRAYFCIFKTRDALVFIYKMRGSLKPSKGSASSSSSGMGRVRCLWMMAQATNQRYIDGIRTQRWARGRHCLVRIFFGCLLVVHESAGPFISRAVGWCDGS